MMKQYWPNAITLDGERLFTYSSFLSREKCIEQFDIWANHYHYKIMSAWIDCDGETEYFSMPS